MINEIIMILLLTIYLKKLNLKINHEKNYLLWQGLGFMVVSPI